MSENTNTQEETKTEEIENTAESITSSTASDVKTVAGVVVTPDTDNSDEDSSKSSTKRSTAEDNLELRRMRFKDRIKAKQEKLRANTQGMSGWEKLKYYVYYYKWHVILGALALFCLIAIPTAIYKNSRPVSISYAVVNSTNPYEINEDALLDYARYYNIVDGYQIRNNLTVTLSQEAYESELTKEEGNASYTQFPTLCYNNYYDIIITDEAGLHYCTSTSLVQPLEDRLYDDIYTAIEEKYPNAIVQSPNYDNKPDEFAIDISGTEFTKSLNVGYDKVYVCFPGGSEENILNIRRFLNYVLELDIEI